MLSVKFFLTVALLQILAAAAPTPNPQGIVLTTPKDDPTGILNTSVNGPASIYTELQGEPLDLDTQLEFEG